MWTKKPVVATATDAPAAPRPRAETPRVDVDQPSDGARPLQPRHRMAGSHDGMYITEHHRGRKR